MSERLAQPYRLPCQVCGRLLVTQRSGLTRAHKAPGASEPYAYCQGTGYRQARWPVGQRLRHHSGSEWVVDEDRGGRYGDYIVRCVDVSRAVNDRERDRVMVAHGEYMHRHGWEPVEARRQAA